MKPSRFWNVVWPLVSGSLLSIVFSQTELQCQLVLVLLCLESSLLSQLLWWYVQRGQTYSYCVLSNNHRISSKFNCFAGEGETPRKTTLEQQFTFKQRIYKSPTTWWVTQEVKIPIITKVSVSGVCIILHHNLHHTGLEAPLVTLSLMLTLLLSRGHHQAQAIWHLWMEVHLVIWSLLLSKTHCLAIWHLLTGKQSSQQLNNWMKLLSLILSMIMPMLRVHDLWVGVGNFAKNFAAIPGNHFVTKNILSLMHHLSCTTRHLIHFCGQRTPCFHRKLCSWFDTSLHWAQPMVCCDPCQRYPAFTSKCWTKYTFCREAQNKISEWTWRNPTGWLACRHVVWWFFCQTAVMKDVVSTWPAWTRLSCGVCWWAFLSTRNGCGSENGRRPTKNTEHCCWAGFL